ncbi:cytochrome ubiquinol oxidase subunit I [Lactobacillus sp. YT155]|uniref:cytochrome ubiquinol oxidase subunit I n=1 Tax=Lactobacillus sp. YT155 TaxID=3060955 RepID=UPI00265F0FBF|nr:cytochrome ubiquinol oxidase subunit I [Lactobacillus sp. YT155]MDO1604898.1 cytochrome ubiquinol oxidase subunit I [Lactobacillus sp. YT155]
MLSLGLSMLDLARFQFAMTTIFHFFFVPFSIGMGFIVAIMETMYVVKKDAVYKKMAKFWGKIFLLSFAVGIVTGIIQEFQFGMNWSNYSRFMGDIFGAPLAIEALLAFFMESVFIGLWMFTWDRVKPKMHVTFIWLTSIGTMLSAIWILAANSFMQHPTGYAINKVTHRVKLLDFGAVVKNPQLWNVFPHLIIAAFATAAFVIVGMSAWALLKKKDMPFYKRSMRVGLWVAMAASLVTLVTGDLQMQQVIKDQPMKFAATEGIYEDTSDPAPWAIVESIDAKNHKATNKIEVPYVLSILTYHKPSGSVKGMNTINKELHAKFDSKFGHKIKDYYVPPKTLFWSFRVMTGIGSLFVLIAALGLYFNRRKADNVENKRWWLYILGVFIWAPFIANTAGWLVTELGRYPWIVYGLYTIADAVSPTTTSGQLLFSNILYFALFTLLGGVMIWYSKKTLNHGPDYEGNAESINVDPLNKEAFK